MLAAEASGKPESESLCEEAVHYCNGSKAQIQNTVIDLNCIFFVKQASTNKNLTGKST